MISPYTANKFPKPRFIPTFPTTYSGFGSSPYQYTHFNTFQKKQRNREIKKAFQQLIHKQKLKKLKKQKLKSKGFLDWLFGY